VRYHAVKPANQQATRLPTRTASSPPVHTYPAHYLLSTTFTCLPPPAYLTPIPTSYLPSRRVLSSNWMNWRRGRGSYHTEINNAALYTGLPTCNCCLSGIKPLGCLFNFLGLRRCCCTQDFTPYAAPAFLSLSKWLIHQAWRRAMVGHSIQVSTATALAAATRNTGDAACTVPRAPDVPVCTTPSVGALSLCASRHLPPTFLPAELTELRRQNLTAPPKLHTHTARPATTAAVSRNQPGAEPRFSSLGSTVLLAFPRWA